MKLYVLVHDNINMQDGSCFINDKKIYTEEEKKEKEKAIIEERGRTYRQSLKEAKEVFNLLEEKGYKDHDTVIDASEFINKLVAANGTYSSSGTRAEYNRTRLLQRIQQLEEKCNLENISIADNYLHWEEVELDIKRVKENLEIESKASETKENIIKKIQETKTIVTHYGDDLDNKSAIYAIEKWAKEQGILKEDENLQVDRVPAGQIKEEMLNVDTGGHKGNRKEENGTIVIDGDPANGVKSASQSLADLGIYVPEQIIELADTIPNKVSALDSRSGLALVRYLSGEQTFALAEEKLLNTSLTDEQLEKFGLVEAHKKQQAVIDNAVAKIEKYTSELPNGEKIVLAPEQITAGSMIAYEMGISYYASASNHLGEDKNPDGVTFAITSKPGTKLPEEVLKYGQELVEEYKIDEKSSGVFVNPNGQMIVAGRFKNPEFKIPNETVQGMLDKVKEKFIGKELSKEESLGEE